MTSTSPLGRTEPGLCGDCRHSRVIASAKGTAFILCERSFTDPQFPKYPPIPVIQCAGFEQKAGRQDGGKLS